MNHAPIDMTEIIKHIVCIFCPMAKDKGIYIGASIQGYNISDENIPPFPKLLGDGRRVKQILMNLVRNAVKFTTTGFIFISTTYQ